MIRSYLVSSILVLCLVPAAIAQAETAAAGDAAFASSQSAASETVVDAISRQLRDRSSETRAQGLQEVLQHALNAPETAGLSALIPDLFWVMREDGNAMHRIMAAQALIQIGDRATLRQVSRLAAADSDRQVQRMVRLAVSAKTREGRG